MKAVTVTAHGGAEVLVYGEAPVPEVPKGHVLIRTEVTSVNFADIKARQGNYKGAPPPFILGLDAAGVIEAIGDGVTNFRVGERVAAYTTGGSYAEKVVADARLCFKLPEGVTAETGAGIGIFITAYNVLTLAGRLEPNDTLLIHAGAGGVGSCLIQMAKMLGAGHIITTVGSDEKRELALELGADEVINYRQESFSERVLELTNNRGADLVLDSIAGETTEEGIRCLADFGRLVVYGHAGAGANIDTKTLHNTNRTVIGYSSGGYRKGKPEVLTQSGAAVMGMLEKGTLKLVVGERYALKDAAQAQTFVESRQSVGKVLLLP